MLCCVPKRPANEGLFHEETPNRPSSIREIRVQLYPEEDALPPILLPCAICARTFMPESLEKHARICERAAAKKRKPFDSAKQRIQGTELAEFLPKQEARRHRQVERAVRPSFSWKKTHDDFLRTIREARSEVMDSRKQCNSLSSLNAPTRANEKGTCPTCNRHFGIKAYDRHVAWCKDRVTRMPVSPATNLAKERLEARMGYRAPALKNRRAINREKYSPGSTANQGTKTSSSSLALVKPKESISVTDCNRENLVKQKPAVVRQLKEFPTSSGPMKSRLADRMNRPIEDPNFLSISTSCRPFHLTIPSFRSIHFPISPTRSKINNLISTNEITSSTILSGKQFDQNETTSQRVQDDETRNRDVCSGRTQRNIVAAKSQGHPKINDITVNDKTLGMTVRPCRIYTDTQKDDQLVTWKQISCKKDHFQVNDPVVACNFLQEFQLLDLDHAVENGNLLIMKNGLNRVDDELKDSEIDKTENNDATWLGSIQNLNQTYLIKDSEDIECLENSHCKSKPSRLSPRVKFYFKDRQDEICEFDKKKVGKTAEDDKERIAEYEIEELKIKCEDREDNRETSDENTEETNYETEKLKEESEDEENHRRANDDETKVAGYNLKKVEINIEGEKNTQEINVAALDKLSMNEGDENYQQITKDERITESTMCTEMKKIEQNLLNSAEHIKLLQDTPKKYEALCSKELKMNYVDNNNYFILDERPLSSQHKALTLHVDDRDSLAFSDHFNHQDYLNFKNEKSQLLNSTEMKHKIKKSMNLLRGSTDILISSVEFVELTSIKQPEINCTYEREIIEKIRPCKRSKLFRGLPDIKDESMKTKEDPEKSYWKKASKISRSRLIDLDPFCHMEYHVPKRNPRVHILPPVPSPSLINQSGMCKDYDPFLLAEQQMNDLLSDTSDQSITENFKLQQTRDTLYPLSTSSAFVKYPPSDRRSSLIAPPFEFDDLTSDFSSDSTETNSITREIFLKPEVLAGSEDTTDLADPKPIKELGRRAIIDKTKALGLDKRRGVVSSADQTRKVLNKITPKVTRPLVNRSNSIRTSSARRTNSGPERRTLGDVRKDQGSKIIEDRRSSNQSLNQRNDNYSSLSGSNISLSSIISSSELDVKRSNSMFDELMMSFEEDTFPGLTSFLNNESFDLSSPMHDGDRQRNGSLISDEELSSPDSYKPQEHSKLSNDSAYSSLNRKYSYHGRSANEVVDRLDEDAPRNETTSPQATIKCKMSKFCHECGQRFPETAKFCCECGIKRLAL